MKKWGIIAFVAMLLTALAVSGALAADKADWKVGGTWNYTIKMPEYTDTFGGIDVKVSAEQKGIIIITAADSGKEERLAEGYVSLTIRKIEGYGL